MKKVLPIIASIALAFTLILSPVKAVYAQIPTPDVAFTPDAEVNFVGKAAARSIQFLNWTLQNYYWQCFEFNNTRTICDNSRSPLIGFWAIIRNIVYAFFALIVLITAFVLITTRGKSLTIQRFLPRFVAVVLLVTFSYAMLQFIYISGDIIQGFFLTKPVPAGSPPGTQPEIISAADLLFVGWDYETFIGLRKVHPFFDESVFVNLLLARMTAVTYYAITGVLLIRKIILWFFIIVSPVFPILLLYYPIRNTAKIWIGEFFRWLMYGPLFSIFLAGLVSLWKAGIPLLFDFSEVTNGRIVYPTATNILLGGPGQAVTISNNLNVPDTFAQYVVALIMLWVVLLLPFVLLQIFLDYLNNFSITESPAFQKIITTSYSLLNKTPPPVPLGPTPPGPASTGVARSLPFAKYPFAQQIPDIRDTGAAKELPFSAPVATRSIQAQINAEILTSSNLSVPTLRDIVSYERASLSQRDSKTVSKTVDALRQIANPMSITNQADRDRFVQIKDKLVRESQSGNSVANAVMSAVNTVNNIQNITNSNKAASNLKNTLNQIANPASAISTVQRDRVSRLKDSLVKESQTGNSVATAVLSTTKEATTTQVQDLREKLMKENLNNNLVATNVLATSMSNVETTTLQQVMKEIANPQIASVADKEKITQMHDSLVKESEKGNEVATAILNAKETATTEQLEDVKEKLVDASLKGDKTATSVLSHALNKSAASQTGTTQIDASLPQTNRVQAVSFEDYEAVKKMWQDNYKDLDAPEGTNKKDWITNEMKDIDGIVTLLSSEDPQQVQEGMQQVSNILPFLLLGGFSKDEIVAYLKAKKEAGKSVLEVIEKEEQEESTMVSVETKHQAASATQAMSQEIPVPASTSSVSRTEDVYEEASPLQQVQQVQQVIVKPVTIQVNEELLKLTNLPVPTMRDLVKFETAMRSRNMEDHQEAIKIKETLQQIAAPSLVTSTTDRERIEQMREKLVQHSEKGDHLAKSILSAANTVAGVKQVKVAETAVHLPETVLVSLREYFASIAHPDTAKPSLKKIIVEDVIALHDQVMQESKHNNQIASDILTVGLETPIPDIQRLWERLIVERTMGSKLAGEVLGHFPEEAKEYTAQSAQQQAPLPQTNRVQTVSLDDYEAVRQMWEENFSSADLPTGETDKVQWLQKEISTMEHVLSLLTANDPERVQEGIQSVSHILPFLLLGGFSMEECVAYLKAKHQAATSVLKSVTQNVDQEELVNVAVEEKKEAQQAAMEAPIEKTGSE